MLSLQMNRTELFQPPAYNLHGRQELWVSSCISAHDSWCGCDTPTEHLLACLLPSGHQDRNLTVQELIDRATNKKWSSGGTGEKDSTAPDTQDGEKHTEDIENLEDVFTEEGIEDLLAAAADDAEPR